MNELSDPVEELIARLKYQARKGCILDGWRVLDIPVAEVQGLKDFPCVTLFMPSMSETYRPGGRGGYALASMGINLVVSLKRTDGIPNLMRGVAKVLNAVERTPAAPSLVDTSLGGTTKPFGVTMANNFVLDLSLNAQITITIDPKPYLRGDR